MRTTAFVAAAVALAAAAVGGQGYASPGADSQVATDPGVATTPVARDTIIRSERWPPAGVAVDGAFHHLGTRTISLGGSTAEIHLLVDTGEEADTGADATPPDTEVRRFYWIQFEGRLPARPGTYDYSDLPHRDTIDGYVFQTDVRYGAYTATEIENEADTGTVGAILAEHGYDFPAPMMRARMVALDESARNELLVIYMEALEWSGMTEAALADRAAWAAAASAALRERAAEGLGLED